MANFPADLLQSILSFEMDAGNVSLSFAQRLARENEWSLDYANRVILEYKRFVFLACTAGRAVTPSEQVDQAWHLHLTYTRSYWDRFCGQVLGRPLHHDPTRGGEDEDRKYREQYERTLQTYEAVFGEPVPADIWPSVDERFARRSPGKRVARGGVSFRLGPLHQGIACVIAGVLSVLLVLMKRGDPSESDNVIRADTVTLVLFVGFAFFAFIIFLIRKFGGGAGGGGGGGGGSGFLCGGGCGSSGCGGGCGGGGCGS